MTHILDPSEFIYWTYCTCGLYPWKLSARPRGSTLTALIDWEITVTVQPSSGLVVKVSLPRSLLHIPDIFSARLCPISRSVCQSAPRPPHIPAQHWIPRSQHGNMDGADSAAALEASGLAGPEVPSRETHGDWSVLWCGGGAITAKEET